MCIYMQNSIGNTNLGGRLFHRAEGLFTETVQELEEGLVVRTHDSFGPDDPNSPLQALTAEERNIAYQAALGSPAPSEPNDEHNAGSKGETVVQYPEFEIDNQYFEQEESPYPQDCS
ncbi:561_t:CDS:2 [Paraglomus occultum]|uniref:561_t:CDS:1 n=1 Tax=Paraglomus occultum TaxID=144539 RepID=A0A9N9A1N4_9GLOM|nr:561_t:CDS:2 [Paraglomus occultum]